MRGFESRRQIRGDLCLCVAGRGFCDPLNLTPFFAGLVARGYRTYRGFARYPLRAKCAFDKDCENCFGILPHIDALLNHALSF